MRPVRAATTQYARFATSFAMTTPSQLQSLAPPPAGGVTAAQLWKATRKHWALVVFVAVACAVGTTFYALGEKTLYRSTATLLIDPNPPQPLGKELDKVVDFSAYWSNKEYYETQFEVIKSRAIATEVVRRLGLNRDGTFLENLPSGTRAPRSVATEEQAASAFIDRLSVDPHPKTRIVELSFADADPARAQLLLNTLIDVFIQHNLDEVAASSQSVGEWLHDRLGKLKQDLEGSELALHTYKKSKSMLSVSYDDQSNMLREQIGQLNQSITESRVQREKIAARYKALSTIDHEDPRELPASELLGSPILAELRSQYIAALKERDKLIATGKGENHPELQSANSVVDSVRGNLLTEVRNLKIGVKTDLDALTSELAGLQGLYETAKREALNLNVLEIEYNRLQRLKSNNERLYSLVLERSKESDLTSLMRVNNIRMLDAPLRGTATGPTVPIMAAAGLLAGLLLGLGGAIGRELMDQSIRTPDDLEQDLGLPFLGLLPRGEGASSGIYYGRSARRRPRPSGTEGETIELMVHQRLDSAVAEAARTIRTNIFFMAPDHPYKTLLVTSPGPGEGKTTVACWLATAMAQSGHRVLLIDCDLRRPRLHKVFARTTEGVADILLNRTLPLAGALRTDIPNLSVLTAGRHVPNPAEVLGSESFQKFLSELSSEYDRVVIDSPPVAAVTDAAVLATRVDGTLLVVRAFATRRDVARRAARAITDVGGRLVGTVLNAADTRRGRGYYYYYYYRGGYESTREDAA